MEEQRRLLLSMRSFTTHGVIVLVLYFVLWVPGVVANIVWLREAKRVERESGFTPAGKGLLRGLLWIFTIVPLVITPLIIVIFMMLHVFVGSEALVFGDFDALFAGIVVVLIGVPAIIVAIRAFRHQEPRQVELRRHVELRPHWSQATSEAGWREPRSAVDLSTSLAVGSLARNDFQAQLARPNRSPFRGACDWLGGSYVRLGAVLSLVGVAWIVVCFQAGWLGSDGGDAAAMTVEEVAATATTSINPTLMPNSPTPKAASKRFSDYWGMEVVLSDQRASVGEPYITKVSERIFVVVEVKVTNVGDLASGFPGYQLHLVDSMGRTHLQDSGATSAHVVASGIYDQQPEDYLAWLPGVEYPNAFVFDVPTGASGFELRSSDSSYATPLSVPLTKETKTESSTVEIEGTFRLPGQYAGRVGDSCVGRAEVDRQVVTFQSGTSVQISDPLSNVLDSTSLREGRIEAAQDRSSGYAFDCVLTFTFQNVDSRFSSYVVKVKGGDAVSIPARDLRSSGWKMSLIAGSSLEEYEP